MPAEAAREDAGRLHRGRGAQERDGQQRAQGETPLPAIARRVVLGVSDHLDEREDVLPARRVTDGEIALLDVRPPRGGVRAQRACVHLVGQEAARAAANEEPVLHRGFLTTPEYARRIRTCAVVVLLAAALAGCGSSSSDEAAPPPNASTTSTAPTSTGEGIDPLEGASTSVRVGGTTAPAIALLERVAVGRHEGYDRVVFQFRGDGLPGSRVQYLPPPLHEDGSGNAVTVAGTAFAVVRMEPASGFDLNSGEGELVYKGPKRVPGASVVREVVRTGDFEAVLTWAVGVEGKVDFRVLTLSSPSRLVVDFRNH